LSTLNIKPNVHHALKNSEEELENNYWWFEFPLFLFTETGE